MAKKKPEGGAPLEYHSGIPAVTTILIALSWFAVSTTVAQAQPQATSSELLIEAFATIDTADHALTSIAIPPSMSSFSGYLYLCGLATDSQAEDLIWRVDEDTGAVEVYTSLSADSDPSTIDFAPEGSAFDSSQLYVCANGRDGNVGAPDCGGTLVAISFTSDPAGSPAVVTDLTGPTTTPCGFGVRMQLTEPSGFVFDGGSNLIYILNSSKVEGDILSVSLNPGGLATVSLLYSDGAFGGNCTSATNGICAAAQGSAFSETGAYVQSSSSVTGSPADTTYTRSFFPDRVQGDCGSWPRYADWPRHSLDCRQRPSLTDLALW